MLDKAIRMAAEAFEGKFDKGGHPYILHCLHVMNAVDPTDHELMIIAVLHDLIEDTPATPYILTNLGFSPRVVSALTLLTHEKGVEYMDYIRAIAMNEDAVVVKRADLRHNSDIMRMKGLRGKDFKRLDKYFTAYEYLRS